MTFNVTITNKANCDIRDIYEYIAISLFSPKSALEQILRLEKTITSLAEMPERHQIYDKEPWKSRGMRIVPVDNYLVFYLINAEKNVVTIVRVIYGGRNISDFLS